MQTAEILPASSKLETIEFHFKRRLTIPMISAPKAPMPPPSVGVNTPAYMPPMTRANNSRVAQTPFKEAIFSGQVVDGPGGPRSGFRRAMT